MGRSFTICVLNCGSSSIKFSLFDFPDGSEFLKGQLDAIGLEHARLQFTLKGQKQELQVSAQDHHQALNLLFSKMQQEWKCHIDAIGHRVVHGGEHFKESTCINDAVIKILEELTPLAPLHNPVNVLGIKLALKTFKAPQVAVFDTAFHQSMPEESYLYPLPYAWYAQHQIRRYGFHGSSYHYVSQKAQNHLSLPKKHGLIIAHLGNGASICAIKNGKSVMTSMGFTPLDGLMMGTRCGSIDPGLIPHLCKVLSVDLAPLQNALNKDSGLKGISDYSFDMRSLEEKAETGHKPSILAISMFCQRVAQTIAAYRCHLESLDALIFTGGIGENSSLVRKQVCQQLRFLGCQLDPTANATRSSEARCITANDALCPVWTIPTHEEKQIALETFNLIGDTDNG
jgi:acetate kinase